MTVPQSRDGPRGGRNPLACRSEERTTTRRRWMPGAFRMHDLPERHLTLALQHGADGSSTRPNHRSYRLPANRHRFGNTCPRTCIRQQETNQGLLPSPFVAQFPCQLSGVRCQVPDRAPPHSWQLRRTLSKSRGCDRSSCSARSFILTTRSAECTDRRAADLVMVSHDPKVADGMSIPDLL